MSCHLFISWEVVIRSSRFAHSRFCSSAWTQASSLHEASCSWSLWWIYVRWERICLPLSRMRLSESSALDCCIIISDFACESICFLCSSRSNPVQGCLFSFDSFICSESRNFFFVVQIELFDPWDFSPVRFLCPCSTSVCESVSTQVSLCLLCDERDRDLSLSEWSIRARIARPSPFCMSSGEANIPMLYLSSTTEGTSAVVALYYWSRWRWVSTLWRTLDGQSTKPS